MKADGLARGEMTAERLAEIREWVKRPYPYTLDVRRRTVADLLHAYDAAQATIQEQANELTAYAEAIAQAEARIAALLTPTTSEAR